MVVHDVAAGRVAEAEYGGSVGRNVKAALVHLPLALIVFRSENTRSQRKLSDNQELGLSLTADRRNSSAGTKRWAISIQPLPSSVTPAIFFTSGDPCFTHHQLLVLPFTSNTHQRRWEWIPTFSANQTHGPLHSVPRRTSLLEALVDFGPPLPISASGTTGLY